MVQHYLAKLVDLIISSLDQEISNVFIIGLIVQLCSYGYVVSRLSDQYMLAIELRKFNADAVFLSGDTYEQVRTQLTGLHVEYRRMN